MIAGAWRWIRENKWKSAGAAAVVGGYLWYRQSQTNNSELVMEKQRMTTYWRDSQVAADSTISKFVPILAKQVEAHTRLFEIVSSLRNPANDTQAKSRLFEELKVAVFSAHMLFMFSLVFIAQYMRISVNVVGRHLYASTRSADSVGQEDEYMKEIFRSMMPKWLLLLNGSEPEPGRKVDEPGLLHISADVRDRCLGSTEFFTSTGFPILADVVSQACIGTLANHPLDENLSLDQVIDIFMHIRNVVEGQFGRPYEGRPTTLLQVILLPPETSLPYSFETPEDAVYSTGLEPEDKLRLLMNEARNVIESGAFQSLLQHTLNVSFATLAESISKSFPKAPAASSTTEPAADPSFPLAKLLPAFSNHYKAASSPTDNILIDRITGTSEFNEFSYRIFHGPVDPAE